MNSDLTIDIWGKGNASCSSSSFSSSSSSKSEAVLGIDLGTSTSCMAIWDKSKSRAKIIKNSHGCRVTPSIICKDKCTGELTLGGSNTTNSSDKTINVICNWKRLLLEPSVEDIQHAKCYHSFIMRYLKQCAEEYLEKKPKECDPFHRAVAFYVVNKCSFSGLSESSSFSPQASDSNFSMRGIERLKYYSQVIKRWQITNLSYEKLLNINPLLKDSSSRPLSFIKVKPKPMILAMEN